MSLFSKLFAPKEQPEDCPEHAVIVHFFDYGSSDLTKLFSVEDELIEAIAATSAGEFDGNEIAVDGSDGYLFMYGPDAEKLFTAIEPVLLSADFMGGAHVTLRFGPPEDGTAERKIVLPKFDSTPN